MTLKSLRTRAAFILTTLVLVVAALTASATAQTFSVLDSFNGADGSNPFTGLIQGIDGNLYGTALNAGANGQGGTVYKITPSGSLTTLYSFCAQPGCTDGGGMWAGLTQATNGNLYGTTAGWGANGQGGTIFKITLSGTMTVLYSFCSQSACTDGGEPFAPPVEGVDGNFYGTTIAGGANPNGSCDINGQNGCGTIYKITPGGTFTTLHTFCSNGDCTDGIYPWGALVRANDGNFYGGAAGGGVYGQGTIFKITPGGTLTTLHQFTWADGSSPQQPMIQATDGNLYGATNGGGSHNSGTLFKMSPSGTLTTLYNFCSLNGCTDGIGPRGALVQANDGNFYGTTLYGGADGAGTIFQITPSGTLTTLYTFCPGNNCAGGADPYPALVQDTNGAFYGTTAFDGAYGQGTIFRLYTGLGPFVSFISDLGKVGQPIGILGRGFTGTTGVSFNGTPAAFTVKSNAFLTATVPTGATTGFVTVTTPSGTLTSNQQFTIKP